MCPQPTSYGTDAPAYWDSSVADDGSSTLGQEQCIIKAEHFFVRGRLVIRVTGASPGTEFDWGVWVSLSRDNFGRVQEIAETLLHGLPDRGLFSGPRHR